MNANPICPNCGKQMVIVFYNAYCVCENKRKSKCEDVHENSIDIGGCRFFYDKTYSLSNPFQIDDPGSLVGEDKRLYFDIEDIKKIMRFIKNQNIGYTHIRDVKFEIDKSYCLYIRYNSEGWGFTSKEQEKIIKFFERYL